MSSRVIPADRVTTANGTPRCRHGFTLIELLVVAILLAIFAAVVVVNIEGADEEAGVPSARQAIQVISKQIDLYRQVNGTWPATIDVAWFQNYKLPLNPLAPNHTANINSDVDGSNNAAKWHPSDKTTLNFPFWYNAKNGAVRIRVPRQSSDTETLALYNAANGSRVTSLSGISLAPSN